VLAKVMPELYRRYTRGHAILPITWRKVAETLTLMDCKRRYIWVDDNGKRKRRYAYQIPAAYSPAAHGPFL
jgi:hypothetical protein